MTARSLGVEQLKLLPEDQALKALTDQREDQWFERKSARTQARSLADLMVGLANAEGGIIVLGIHDGEVEGVGEANRLNDWRQAALDFTRPPVRHDFTLLDCTNRRGLPDSIALVEVESGQRVHETAKGETFLRVGDENRRLGPLEAQELRYDKGEATYDSSVVPGTAAEELDDLLVGRYAEAILAQDASRALRARGLMTDGESGEVPTVAGLMVLGGRPQQHLPEAFVRVLRYSGASRETGVRSNVAVDERFEGPIGSQVDATRSLVAELLPSAVRLERDARFDRGTMIPEFAWVEAIVNALTHRSYSAGGDHVRVELFDDRIEVESPGRLPGLVRVESIRSSRFARNPRIARAMSDLGYGRELGEGVDRMFEEMNRAGLPDPIYAEGPASVRVTLLADALAGRILERLPAGSERFAEYLSSRDRVTTTEAVELLGVSRPTALKYLHDLAEQGLIEHVGTSLKDPRGHWELRRGARG